MKEAMGYEQLKDPATSDVIITTTSVFKGKPAGPGNIYFICTLKRGKVTYSNQFIVCRKDMPKDVEEAIKQKIKINFVQQVIDEVNKRTPANRIKTIK